MRLNILTDGGTDSLNYHPGPTMLEILQNSDFQVDSVCGGAGTCTKCRVQVTGFCPISAVDRKSFSESELSDGWRLSCQSRPRVNLAVKIPKVENFRNKPRVICYETGSRKPEARNPTSQEGEGRRDVIPTGRGGPYGVDPRLRGEDRVWNDSVHLVCDLGSTGVVVALGSNYQNRSLEVHLLNKQVRFGGDVMTRLHNASKYGIETLQKAVLKTIQTCLKAIETEDPNGYAEAIKHPVICAGNSAMTSLLLGWDIQSLAVSPYQPETLESGQFRLDVNSSDRLDPSLRGEDRGGRQPCLQTVPLLGGFVGGDTAAAILYIESIHPTGPWMMVDIGTNTEVVIKDSSGTFWFASAPAGPAFEGGNITKGMRAEPGAVSEAEYNAGSQPSRGGPERGSWSIQTIGDDIPKGICGSGLIEIVDQAVQSNLIHKDGYIPGGRLDVVDGIFLMADDVREFQLAKAATRTAVDILIQKAFSDGFPLSRERPIPDERIGVIYFAGTFASHLNQTSVKRLGLLPDDIPIQNIGNGSLKGAFIYAQMSEKQKAEFETRLHQTSKQIELALEDAFQAQFVENLNF